MAFMKTKIEFCGKQRQLKRCTNQTLLEFQKGLEAIQKDLEPALEREQLLEDEIEEITSQISQVTEQVELIKNLEDPTDEELRTSITLLSEARSLTTTRRELTRDLRLQRKKDQKNIEKIEADLNTRYANLACLLIDPMTPGEWEENADPIDMVKIHNLVNIYKMGQGGFTQNQIDKEITKMVKNNLSQTDNFRQEIQNRQR